MLIVSGEQHMVVFLFEWRQFSMRIASKQRDRQSWSFEGLDVGGVQPQTTTDLPGHASILTPPAVGY